MLFRKTTTVEQTSNTPAGVVAAPAPGAPQSAAYEQGRRDAAQRAQQRDQAVRQAYERGRRDERTQRPPRRRGAPLLTLLLLVVAAVGAYVIYLGVSQGSFSRGGQVVDNATQSAGGAVRNVADRAGDALVNAGQSLKHAAG